MKFFDRQHEIESLRRTWEKSREVAQFTVVTGRRRIGKTTLVLHALADTTVLYFFVSRKAEAELCNSFVAEIEERLGIPLLGHSGRFADIFEYLMNLSKKQHITLFIDEFQEFYKVNKSVFSDMQRIWDLNKQEAHMNLIVGGSVNAMMNRIFRDKKEPLYGRHTSMMHVRPFTPSVLSEILRTYAPQHTSEDLLALYLFTGGVAKYVEVLMDGGHFTLTDMLAAIMHEDSLFLDEGKASLIEEFGRDYGIYFSILSLIAQGHNTRSDIETMLKQEVGGYLTKLMDDYELITKRQPLFEKSSNKGVHYTIDDNFLAFWFRFIFKYNYMLEIGAHEKLQEVIVHDYETYSGRVLEKYFIEKLAEAKAYTRIGFWADRKGENEIDIIAADETRRIADFFEVKRKAENINLDILQAKVAAFQRATGQFTRYTVTCHGLSMDNMTD